MRLEIQCTTGGEGSHPEIPSIFFMNFDDDAFEFGFSHAQVVILPLTSWSPFITQVQSKELSRLRFDDKVPPPIGLPQVRTVFSAIDSTPRLQLIYSAFEIAALLGLPNCLAQPLTFYAQPDFLQDRYTGKKGAQGLYFLPRHLAFNDRGAPNPCLKQLMDKHVLCELEVRIPGSPVSPTKSEIYYVPYNMPIIMRGTLPPDAEDLLYKIRTLRNAATQGGRR
jgi:hypothetical protein